MKFVPEEKSDQHVIAWLGKRAGNALKVLDRHLFTQEWVAADRITTADLSCVGYLYYDHEFGHDLTAYPEHRALAPGDRRASRLEAPLRPDAGPPDPGAGPSHDRRLYLRRHPHPARQGPPRRQPARGDRAPPLRRHAERARRPATGLPENAVEDVIWGNVTQVGEQGGCLARSAVLASDLRREASPASRSTASAPPASRR